MDLYSCRVLSQLSCLLDAFGVDSNHATREACSSFFSVYDESLRQCVLVDVISMLPGENLLFHQLPSLMLYLGVLCLFPKKWLPIYYFIPYQPYIWISLALKHLLCPLYLQSLLQGNLLRFQNTILEIHLRRLYFLFLCQLSALKYQKTDLVYNQNWEDPFYRVFL